MAPTRGVALRALLTFSALLNPTIAVPFRRFTNSTVAPYSNSTQPMISPQLLTGSSEPTSQSTSIPQPSSLTPDSTDLPSAPSDGSAPSDVLVTMTETDTVFKSCDQSTTALAHHGPATSVVFVTQTEDDPGDSPSNPLTSVVYVTQTVDTHTSTTADDSEVIVTSVQTVEAHHGPGTFLVLVTSTQTVDVAQPTATTTSTLSPKMSGTGKPVTSVTVVTVLETSGVVTSQPIATGTKTVLTSVTPSALSSAASVSAVGNTNSTGSVNPFRAIATDSPPSQITATGNHPQPTTGIAPQTKPLHTNKFYANLFLGDQMSSVFTHPYSLSWANGSGATHSYGFAIQHIEASQRAYGPANTKIPGSPASYYINPLGYQTIVLSAKELGKGTVLTADSLDTFSVNANLQPSVGSPSSIKFPMLQGMGFVTGIYTSLQPQIETGVFFKNVAALGNIGNNVYKWRLSMNDGTTWLMYAIPSQNASGTPSFAPSFTQVNNSILLGPASWNGNIQIAKNPVNATNESVYDKAAGSYPTTAAITGSVVGKTGRYTLTYSIAGINGTGRSILQYALPHHLESFDSNTMSKVVKNMTLQTTTKGIATAVVGNAWTLVESSLPIDMGFAPWRPSNGTQSTYSSRAVNAIFKAAQVELNEDISGQTNGDSMYFSGKALTKFAQIVYAVAGITNQPDLAKQGLASLEKAMNVFTSNKQQHPLVYDTVWKGIVSSASYNGGDALADFGNTFYNDHHFHYGYFLYAAAVIGSLDAAWLAANKAWVNALARDVNNPSAADPYFPVFRNFDWYHGHSWAKGLFESGDSKDEESTSEDVMFSYGLKMWGHVTGDAAMEARGNLMLAVTARSLHDYFLMEADNAIQPAPFIGNKVTGILFDNKVDHTTYFGTNLEYIQGIHMLPLTPASTLTRRTNFVKEEWNTYFKPGAVDDAANVTGGWKGILYANLAIIDPVSSFNFFNQDNFDMSWLDGGASKTWYLAFAAGLGGA